MADHCEVCGIAPGEMYPPEEDTARIYSPARLMAVPGGRTECILCVDGLLEQLTGEAAS